MSSNLDKNFDFGNLFFLFLPVISQKWTHTFREFSIEISNDNDVDETKKKKHNHHVAHLFFVCSFVFVEYLEHMHRRSRVQFERRTNDIFCQEISENIGEVHSPLEFLPMSIDGREFFDSFQSIHSNEYSFIRHSKERKTRFSPNNY